MKEEAIRDDTEWCVFDSLPIRILDRRSALEKVLHDIANLDWRRMGGRRMNPTRLDLPTPEEPTTKTFNTFPPVAEARGEEHTNWHVRHANSFQTNYSSDLFLCLPDLYRRPNNTTRTLNLLLSLPRFAVPRYCYWPNNKRQGQHQHPHPQPHILKAM